MTPFTVEEWKSLPIGPGGPSLDQARALGAASEAAGFAGGVISLHSRHIAARGVVGVLTAKGASLEILPKIDDDRGSTRRRLVQMLAVAHDLKLETGAVAAHDWQNETLLDILIRIFADKLTEALRRGLPRLYRQQTDDLPALRGSLDVTRQFTVHAVNPARLACRFDARTEDMALNRILKATVRLVSGLARRFETRQRLAEIALVYADVADVSPLPWDEVILDRTNQSWAELLGLARLFHARRYQTASRGAGQGVALLFEMAALFETYVGRKLQRGLAGTGRRAVLQGGLRFALDPGARGVFQTRPDILVLEGGRPVEVIDTKWKAISSRIDDRKSGVAQADVYQMMAYAQIYRVPRVTLLYPHHGGLGSEGVLSTHAMAGSPARLRIASFDIGSAKGIERRLADLVQDIAPAEGVP